MNKDRLNPGLPETVPTAPQDNENVKVSMPDNDRPTGPFEHSGETARQTQAEEAESLEQKEQG